MNSNDSIVLSPAALAALVSPGDDRREVSPLGSFRHGSNAARGIALLGCLGAGGNNIAAAIQDQSGDRYHRTEAQKLAPVADLTGAIEVVSMDYSCLGSVAQARLALQQVLATGSYNINSAARTASGTIQDYDDIKSNPIELASYTEDIALGVQIDWSIALSSYAPFDADIEIFAVGLHGQNVGRKMTLRFAGNALGGRLFIPTAYRAATQMDEAQVQPLLYKRAEEVEGTPPFVGPRIAQITLQDSAISTAFSARVRLLTAFTPGLGEYAAAAGLLAAAGV